MNKITAATLILAVGLSSAASAQSIMPMVIGNAIANTGAPCTDDPAIRKKVADMTAPHIDKVVESFADLVNKGDAKGLRKTYFNGASGWRDLEGGVHKVSDKDVMPKLPVQAPFKLQRKDLVVYPMAEGARGIWTVDGVPAEGAPAGMAAVIDLQFTTWAGNWKITRFSVTPAADVKPLPETNCKAPIPAPQW